MNFERINVFFIIKDHLRNVRDSLWLFLFFPFLLSIGLCGLGIFIDSSVVSILIPSLSIFIALFVNVNILLIDMKKRAGTNPDRVMAYEETQVTISFLIVTGLFAIMSSYGCLCSNWYLSLLFNLITYFLLGLFSLTVMMTIKNVHVLFDDDLTRTK